MQKIHSKLLKHCLIDGKKFRARFRNLHWIKTKRLNQIKKLSRPEYELVPFKRISLAPAGVNQTIVTAARVINKRTPYKYFITSSLGYFKAPRGLDYSRKLAPGIQWRENRTRELNLFERAFGGNVPGKNPPRKVSGLGNTRWNLDVRFMCLCGKSGKSARLSSETSGREGARAGERGRGGRLVSPPPPPHLLLV